MMKILPNLFTSATFRPAGPPALASGGALPAPADTYGPSSPEDLHGLYGRPAFEEDLY